MYISPLMMMQDGQEQQREAGGGGPVPPLQLTLPPRGGEAGAQDRSPTADTATWLAGMVLKSPTKSSTAALHSPGALLPQAKLNLVSQQLCALVFISLLCDPMVDGPYSRGSLQLLRSADRMWTEFLFILRKHD